MKKNIIIPILLIVAVSVIVSLGKIQGEFLADDFAFNLKARDFVFSLKSLPRLGLFDDVPWFYRPLPLLLWICLFKVFGPVPVAFYLAFFLLHVLNSVLMFLLLGKLVRQEVALISACVFSVFTGHMGALYWLSGIFDVLSTQFILIALLLLVASLETRRVLLYFGSLVSAVAAILSKETAVVLPGLVAALSLFCLRRHECRRGLLLRSAALSVPYAVIFLIYLKLRLEILHGFEIYPSPYTSHLDPKAVWNYGTLFGNLIVPCSRNEAVLQLLPFAVGVFALFSVICFMRRKHCRAGMLFGYFWLLVTALPYIKLVSLNGFMSRFNYLPAIGFCLVLAQLVLEGARSGRSKRFGPLLPCVVIGLYSANTLLHAGMWKKAWQASSAVQKSFKVDILPRLNKPARAYFFKVPEFTKGVAVFFSGLPECFSLLSDEPEYEFRFVPEAVFPTTLSPERVPQEERVLEYYVFDWDSSTRRFHEAMPPFWDSRPFHPDRNILSSWDFSRLRDSSAWKLTDGQTLPPEGNRRTFRFMTHSAHSLLVSPPINERIKYVRVTCRVAVGSEGHLNGQVFWTTRNSPSYDKKRSLTFPVKSDDSLHTYWLPLWITGWSFREPIMRLSFNMSVYPGTLVEVQSVTLYSF